METLQARPELWTRRSFIGAGSASFVLPFRATSAAARSRRVGLLVSAGYEPMVAAFVRELHALGYVAGENVHLEIREWESNSEDVVGPANVLVQSDVDFIVAGALPQALAVRSVSPNMPMVIVTCPGMVSNGFAESLARPAKNVTGMDELPPGLTRKRLTLLKAIAPAVSRVALLSTTPGRGGHDTQLADAVSAAPALGLQVKPYRATSVEELDHALTAIAADGINGLANFQGRLSLANRKKIVAFAAEKRIPAVYQATLFAEAGGLMAWAPDLVDQYRSAARYAAMILRGASPGDLPIRYPDPYYLTINETTAVGLGLEIPSSLRSQAHRILT